MDCVLHWGVLTKKVVQTNNHFALLAKCVAKQPYALGALLLRCAVCFLLLCTYSAAFASQETAAQSWQAVLAKHPATPPRLIAVDKDKQELYVYNIDNQLKLQQSYVCTTGQKVGDKLVQGDLKTPEGVYFVVQHLASGLDFTMYGNEAFTLNYPNPVDRLRKKTGYGIWIHGRGEKIRPLITQGCVALNNEDLKVLGDLLEPGTPVALTSSLAPVGQPPAEQIATVTELKNKVHGWAKAWGSRSASMFSYYDAAAYSIAQGEDFSKFKAQKERLFKNLPWIKNNVYDVQVLQGPGYWVTWFYQDYQAPNLSTQGIRRLYWQKNDKNEFVIIGMEWVPGLSSGTLLASAEPANPPIEVSPKSEEQAIPVVEAETPDAPPSAAAVAVSTGAPLNATLTPESNQGDHTTVKKDELLARPMLALTLAEQGKLPNVTADKPFAVATASPVGTHTPVQAPMQSSAAQVAAPAVTAPVNTLNLDLPPPIPAQGLAASSIATVEPTAPIHPESRAARPVQQPAVQSTTEQTAPAQVTLAEAPAPRTEQPAPVTNVPQASATEPAPVAMAEAQAVVTPSTEQQVSATQQVASTPAAPEAQPSAPAPHHEATRVLETIEEWRQAWEKGDVTYYMEFYDANAAQGTRKGVKSIKRHKEGLWARVAPKKVLLTAVTPQITDTVATVHMVQEYTDSKGQKDIGNKIITLKYTDNMWFIISEDWSPLAQ